MTDEDPQAGRRVRRRASRSAGPTGADAEAASTVVAGAPVSLGKSDTPAEPKAPAEPKVTAPDSPTPDSPTPDSPTPDITVPGGAKPKAGLVVGIAVASVIAVALAAVTVLLLVDRNTASNADEQRATYVAGARTTALNLTTLHADTAAADLDKFLAGTTDEFKSQFDGRKDSFVNVLGQAGVQTDGEVLEAGLEKSEGACGTSLVAVRAMQKNGDEEPAERNYRLRITMCDVDGQLLASNVEFVP